MFTFILMMVIILVVIKVLFKFMYPKPPQAFFPKEGDDTTIRTCNYCGHTLATYRGILENDGQEERFFCNDEHKTAFESNLLKP